MADFNSLFQLMNAIPDESAAIAHFTAIRWKNGAFCPYCGSVRVYHFADQKTHKCGDCRQRFSIKVGTMFEDSKIPLRKWLMAIWLLTSHKKGIASTQLARDIAVTQKTAWFMLHRLRAAAATKSFNRPLDGAVEVDETAVGGLEKNKHANKRTHGGTGFHGKSIVMGLLERDGELRAGVIPDVKGPTVKGIVRANVAAGAKVYTDSWRGYVGLRREFQHSMVNHSAGEYVRDDVHTNSIEGVWALLKRQIIGIHHWVSPKHLSRYVDEMSWRYNRRAMAEGARADALIAGSDGRLTYKALIA